MNWVIVSFQQEGFPVVYIVHKCHSDTEAYWITPLFAYKFILLAVGVILAFSIRKVEIKELNDSKEVSAILYITTAILLATLVCIFIFGDYINVDGAIFGFGICTATSFVLGLIFVPKVICHDEYIRYGGRRRKDAAATDIIVSLTQPQRGNVEVPECPPLRPPRTIRVHYIEILKREREHRWHVRSAHSSGPLAFRNLWQLLHDNTIQV